MDGYAFASILRKRSTGRVGPDRPAVTLEARTLTYTEPDERSERLAGGLATAGFKKG